MPGVARHGDIAFCPADAHGCTKCAHQVRGPAIESSTDVFVNGFGALRQGDAGIHAPCCGPNRWTAAKGSPGIFVNGKPVMRQGDMTQHCGGVGKVESASGDVAAGGVAGGATVRTDVPEPSWVEIELRDSHRHPVRGRGFELELPAGEKLRGRTDPRGRAWVPSSARGEARIRFTD